ncbi:MAG: S1 RNA-binding domain-containing protein, partial [Rhodospirillales bacterium]
DPFESGLENLKKGSVVTCTVTGITNNGIEVKVGEGINGFIRRSELSRDRSEQRPDRFAPDEKVDAKITQVDAANRKVTLSIKQLEVEQEKQVLSEYGSSSAGARLGDILGAAIEEKRAAANGENTGESEK